MAEISLGKLRGLARCSSSQGTFTCLALDHRQNLRRALNPADPASVLDERLTDFKLEVTRQLASDATAVLLDPQYSAAQAIAAGALPGRTGLVVALEATGYTGQPDARQSRLLPGWSVAKARRMGADMVKLLVYYHPESPTAVRIRQFVAAIAQDCAREDLALMLEPLSYSLDPQQPRLSSQQKRDVVVESARQLTPLGVDLLKVEFPAQPDQPPMPERWLEACQEISAASRCPWILLSAGVDFESYLEQVRVACQAGASGVAVGRAVWKEALALSGAARHQFLAETARSRLERLGALCDEQARPWRDAFPHPVDNLDADWYQDYGA